MIATLAAMAGCSRSFSAPNQEPRLADLQVVTDGGGTGQVLFRPNDIPIIRGTLTVRVTPAAGQPVAAVEFFTPGRIAETVAAPDFTWATETSDIYPEGGVLIITATPIGAGGTRGPPLQASFIVDNGRPFVTVLSPTSNDTLSAGVAEVDLCERDRTPETPVTVLVNGIPGIESRALEAAHPELQARCFTASIPADPGQGDLLNIEVEVTDDVGNTGTALIVAHVSRVLAAGHVPGEIASDNNPITSTNVTWPAFAFPGGLLTDLIGTDGFVAAWTYLDGGDITWGLPPDDVLLGVAGSPYALDFGVDTLDGGALVLAFTPLENGGPVAATFFAGEAASTSLPIYDQNEGVACATLDEVVTTTQQLVCRYGDGGGPSRALTHLPEGTEFDTLLILGDRLWAWSGVFTTPRLDRFALADLASIAGPASPLGIRYCTVENRFGAMCSDGSVTYRFDAATQSAMPVPGVGDCGGGGTASPELQHCLAVTRSGVLVIQNDPPRQGAILEYPVDGGAPVLWGCLPDSNLPEQASSDPFPRARAELAADGHLYVAAPTHQGTKAEVVAFAAPGQLAWSWTDNLTTGLTNDAIHLVLDESTPDSPLWLTFDGTGEVYALSRHDPVPLVGGNGCAQ